MDVILRGGNHLSESVKIANQLITSEFYSDVNSYIPIFAGLDYSIIALEDKQIIAYRQISLQSIAKLNFSTVNAFKNFCNLFGNRCVSTIVKRGGEKVITSYEGVLYCHTKETDKVTVLAALVVKDPSVFEIKQEEGKTLFESSSNQKFTKDSFNKKVLEEGNYKLLVDLSFSTNTDFINLYSNFKSEVENTLVEKGIEVVYVKDVKGACMQEEIIFDKSIFKTSSQMLKYLKKDLPSEITDFERISEKSREPEKDPVIETQPQPVEAVVDTPPDRVLSESQMRDLEQMVSSEPIPDEEWNPWDDPEFGLGMDL